MIVLEERTEEDAEEKITVEISDESKEETKEKVELISIKPELEESVKDDSARRLKQIVEENEIMKIQIKSREREIEELRRELDDIHASISYRFGRWVAETKVGGALKSFLRKYIFK